MTKIKCIIIFLIPYFLYAQDSFQIRYKESVPINIDERLAKVPSSMRNNVKSIFKNKFPTGKVNTNFILLTDEKSSIYKVENKLSNTQNPNDISSIIQQNRKEIIYKIFDKDSLIETHEVLGEKFLIADVLKNKFDSITPIYEEDSVILNFNVKHILYELDSTKTHIYFSEEIKSKDGPSIFQGMPGLILKVVEVNLADKIIREFEAVEVKKRTKPIKIPAMEKF